MLRHRSNSCDRSWVACGFLSPLSDIVQCYLCLSVTPIRYCAVLPVALCHPYPILWSAIRGYLSPLSDIRQCYQWLSVTSVRYGAVLPVALCHLCPILRSVTCGSLSPLSDITQCYPWLSVTSFRYCVVLPVAVCHPVRYYEVLSVAMSPLSDDPLVQSHYL